MGRKRKYPKTQGYYVYVHITPEKDCYFGMSKQQPSKRWHPSLYKDKSLYPYIEQFGWENIEHRVLFDNLTEHQAEVLEDWFITNSRRDGFCINHNRNFGYHSDNTSSNEHKREYNRQYRHNCYHNITEIRERNLEYQREYYYNRCQNNPEYKERKREYQRQYRLKKKLERNS